MTRQAKDNLRVRNNQIERLVSSLKPDLQESPEAYDRWEKAMELLGEQFRSIQDLPVLTENDTTVLGALKLYLEETDDPADAAYIDVLGKVAS